MGALANQVIQYHTPCVGTNVGLPTTLATAICNVRKAAYSLSMALCDLDIATGAGIATAQAAVTAAASSYEAAQAAYQALPGSGGGSLAIVLDLPARTYL